MVLVEERFRDGVAAHKAHETDFAARIYEEVLREAPHHAGAWHLLGVVHHGRGDLRRAQEHIERALSFCKTKAVYWNNYGAVLKDLGRLDEAQKVFESAVKIRDAYPDAWSNLGLIRCELGQLEEAERCLRYALRLDPRHADALRHLARVCRDKGDLEEAARLCRDALAVAPGRAETHVLLGEVLSALKRFKEAAAAYRQALAVQPDSADCHVSLGLVYSDLDDVEEARRLFAKAATLRPDKPTWGLRELGLCPIVFENAESVTEYRDELERRLEQMLEDPPLFDWREALRDGFVPSFQVCHHGLCNRALKEKFARLFAPSFPQERPKPRQGDKIRVGFLTTAGHEGGFLRGFGGIMDRLDRREFEVAGLVSAGIVPFCRRAVRSTDIRWIGFPHEIQRAYRMIREAQCDVIVHWQVGTDILNYFLPLLPLAPVQCIGFGMHGTTGIANLDYFLSSRLFERGDDAAEDYAERLVQFAGATAWQPRPPGPAPATRADFGLPASGPLYFCPQRLAKFHPDFDRLLRQILDADATGHVLVLKGERRHAAEALRARFARTLGERLAQRVLFLPPQPPAEYCRLLSLVDVILDAPDYSSSLTGYDAFSLGVPIVTLPGAQMVQRYALGLYRQMGIRGVVAGSEQEYVDLAVRLGRDADFRQAMRREILDHCEVLYEDDRVVREYEAFFRHV